MGPQAVLTPDHSVLWINLEQFYFITMENKGYIDKSCG